MEMRVWRPQSHRAAPEPWPAVLGSRRPDSAILPFPSSSFPQRQGWLGMDPEQGPRWCERGPVGLHSP